MQIHIQSSGFDLSDALREYVRRRLHFALSHAADRVRRVTVRLSDINGPRGGPDKRCHIVASLDGLPGVVIEDTEGDLYVAIDRAVDRAGRAVARRLGRKQERRAGYGRERPSGGGAEPVSSPIVSTGEETQA